MLATFARCELFGGPRDGEIVYLPLPMYNPLILPVYIPKHEILSEGSESFLMSADVFDWYEPPGP